jgi:hypothetical protein
MTRYAIYYQSRELAKELGDPQLGIVEADSTEEAVRQAERCPQIGRRAMPCAGFWAVRLKDELDQAGKIR